MSHLPLVVVLLLATSAGAQTLDRVVLRDGSVLQGVISRAGPDGNLELVSPAGERQALRLDDIAEASGPAFGDPLLHPWLGRQAVHIEAVNDAETHVGVAEGSGRSVTTRQLCRAPCTLFAHPGGLNLRIGNAHGDGSDVHVAVPPGGLALGVKAPRHGAQFAMVGVGGGVALLMAGVMTTVFADGYTDKAGTVHPADNNQRIGGGVLIGAGVVTLSSVIIAMIAGHGGLKWQRPLRPELAF